METDQSKIVANDIQQEFVFDVISAELNSRINAECGEMIQKGLFPTNMHRGIQVFIFSGDHLPIHFHVRSPQRYLDAKFQLDPLKLIENKTSIRVDKDENFIIRYFTKNKHLLDEIRAKFMELNPNLNYES